MTSKPERKPLPSRISAGLLRSRLPRILIAASILAGPIALAPATRAAEQVPHEPAESEAAAAAAAAVGGLKQALGGALRTALADGPEAAIEVCRVAAPRLTEASAKHGLRVGRTSQRLRNPSNAPEDWMLPLLEEYLEAEPRPGSSRTVDLGARGTGYVEPIYLQPLCSVCHGANVEPALLEKIRERYPDDEAVGFEVGELRGLFWAVVPPPQ